MLESMFHLPLPWLEKVLRPVVVYLFLIIFLRLFGKRELAQLNPFDLVVLLSLSNTVQNAIIGEDNSVTGGVIGAFSLLAINWLVAQTLFRSPNLTRMIEGRSTILVRDGKIDRRALPQPQWKGGSVAFTAPANDTETRLAALYCEVLGIERVGTGHNFFELGGNSISATRLVSRIRAEFGNDFPLRTFFESPDILTLARRLSETARSESTQSKTATTAARVPIKRALRRAVSVSGGGGG